MIVYDNSHYHLENYHLLKAERAIVLCRFAEKTWTESLTEPLCCVVYSLSQSSLSGETGQYNGYLFFSAYAPIVWLVLM